MKFKLSNTWKATLPLALGLAVASSGTQALSLWGGLNAFEDDNMETQGVDLNQNGLLDMGDTIRGTITFTKQFDPFSLHDTITLGAPGEELTGIFETEVVAKIDNGDGTFNYVFGAYSGFEADYGTNAMVALFTENPGDFYTTGTDRCSSIVDCETKATDGSAWMTFGVVGDADNFWVALNVDGDDVDFSNVAASRKVGFVNYALSVLTNSTPYTILQQVSCSSGCAGDGLVDIIGSGDLLGGQGLTNGYTVRSDIDFQIRVVPTPGSLALLGLGLLGLAGARSRKKA
ncbi:MAG: hypothetical protein DRR42_25905 [Gammaproteobacteria bacterium]|nr:MAG: hypothetical protein DRR42_25905 [Gammaproteobacteria bacterium]